jgi:DNA repair exonuclease SbcCD ATPase subunit
MTNLSDLLNRLERLKGRRDVAEDAVSRARTALDAAKQRKVDAESAQAFLQAVAAELQAELTYRVTELANLAMAAIFSNPYTLTLDFTMKRGRTEADIYFVRGGKRISPKWGAGGGPKDVAAMALRLALWSLRKVRTRPLMVFDEPFVYPSKDIQGRVGAMLKQLSHDIGIQMIYVSHEETYVGAADRVFRVVNNGGESSVSVEEPMG